MKRLNVLLLLFFPFYFFGQHSNTTLINKYAQASLDDFLELLAIPNDAFMKESIEENVQWMENAFTERNFEVKRLETPSAPLLLAEKAKEGATKTVLVYLQMDGQPVDASKWQQESPWKPVLKHKDEQGNWEILSLDQLKEDIDPEWRIFARSASDAKGPVVAFLTALDIIQALKQQPNYNLKIIMDFEEEQGSPNLPAAVEKYKDVLAADMLIIFDGPRHISNRPTLTFGARGISTITLTVYGPVAPQHSGHYGNYAPNPALRLMQLVSSMKDEKGRVTIPGYYDGIELDEKTKAILRQVPDDEATIQRTLGIGETDAVADSYQESIQYPSLNVRGLSSGWIGRRVRTIIPATATAEIDVRTVIESDPERLIQLIRKHIEEKGYHLLDREPTTEEREQYPKLAFFRAKSHYGAFRTEFDSEVGEWLDRAMTKAFGEPPVKLRTSGGSIPISPFVNALGIPAVTVPTVNRDNNQHSPNENIRLGNYFEAVQSCVSILMEEL
ncbi:MAG: M20/M25/M40 family metallo-hydrolase [Bacteroidota bacterium]